ncbi:MAG TPA: TIM barrel protein, partial [Blastocatellia bacterium]|nr:TIM barrel protein [Blastocatellia bacterium]
MAISRREILWGMGAAAVGSAVMPLVGQALQSTGKVVRNGRLKQSVARWCYNKIPLPEFCKAVADMGLPAIDLLDEKEWEVAAQYGLICSLGWRTGGGGIPDGLNNKANHDAIIKGLERSLPLAAKAKVPNLIAFFGNRKGIPDAEAADNCILGLNRIKKAAEDTGVNVVVELLNSKVDHKDYHGDHTPFGVRIIKAVDSPRVKLLYDIYHMQIMEGDVIRTIRDNIKYIGHFHTGGVPGRNELDDTQELNWRTVCKAILDTGFTGYVAHEFVPKRDPITSLREAV